LIVSQFKEGPDEELPESEALQVWTVSQLTALVRGLLEEAFPAVWVAGEISNFTQARSGHCYFTLKDERAAVRTVMWKPTAQRLRFELHDGLEVLIRGGLTLYAERGDYQLIVQQIEPLGLGPLELALRQLRAKLQAEGLFDPARKRPLPRFPRRVAFVTSPTGAAIRDFLEVLRRRFPGTDVLIVPSRVQGEGAADEIVAGIQRANAFAEPLGIEVLVVGRGGGSLEDLWPFNEERVARAIFASRIPVMSAVGHETDYTISDQVADVRALTPSEAAERLAPAREDLLAGLRQHQRLLQNRLRGLLERARTRLTGVANRPLFRRPFAHVQEQARKLDDLAARQQRAMQQHLELLRGRVAKLAAQLQSLSPLAVLARGYTVTRRAVDGQLVRDPGDIAPGELILTQLATGELLSRIEESPREILGPEDPSPKTPDRQGD